MAGARRISAILQVFSFGPNIYRRHYAFFGRGSLSGFFGGRAVVSSPAVDGKGHDFLKGLVYALNRCRQHGGTSYLCYLGKMS